MLPLKRIVAASVLAALALLPTAPTAPRVDAAGMVVNSLADANPPVTDGLCSLREAIANANDNASTHPDCPAGTGADTITFSVSGTIVLATSLPAITDAAGLTIDGSGQSVTMSGNNAVRPVTIALGAIAELRALTISDGRVAGKGGGVENGGSLTLLGVTVTGNLSVGFMDVYCHPFIGCIPYYVTGDGGGVHTYDGALMVVNSTISGNSATDSGGGIYGRTLTVTNSTITGNRASSGGGVLSSTATIMGNTIVAGNTATSTLDGPDCAGGPITASGPNLIGDPTGCTITGTPPITGDPKLGPLTDNGGPTQTNALLPGSPALDNGDDAICAAAPVSGKDQRGVARPQGAHCDLGAFESDSSGLPLLTIDDVSLPEGISGLNPFTFTVTLSSAASSLVTVHYETRDGTALAGSDYLAVSDTLLTFAVGETKKAVAVQVKGDTNYEPDEMFSVALRSAVGASIVLGGGRGTVVNDDAKLPFVVSTLADGGPGSLRETMLDANAASGSQTITFSVSGTILLATALPDITDSAGLTIDGGGQSISISGNNTVLPFAVSPGMALALVGLTVTQGNPGIINNSGTLTVTDSTVSGSNGVFSGIVNSGTLTVTNSTISGNSALSGGGISNSGTLTVTNSTISGNRALGPGGIYNFGTLVVTNSTISGNTSNASAVGGIHNEGTLTLSNSIVAGNTSSAGPRDCAGTLTATGPNLIGDPTGCTITGTPPLTGDARLGPLADNGGPTQTHALLPGSPAIDAGDDAVCAAAPVSGKDQRGVSRPQGARCDLGAFELEASAPVVGGKNLTITTGSIDLAWDGGTAQTGYTLLQYNAVTSSATLVNLPASATSYGHSAAVPGGMYCYAVAAKGPGDVVLGLSDLECAMAGIKTGAVAPVGFALALNQSATATLTWTAPAGGADAYLLRQLPLDGTPPSHVMLSGSATSSSQSVPAAGACFQLVAYQGAAWGTHDVLCGIPGFSTLGKPAGGGVQTVGEAMGDIRQRLLAVTAPVVK